MTKQSRLSGALYLMIAQGIVLVLGYITHPLIGRFLGPAAYGIFGIVLSVQSIVGLLLTLGVPIAVSRFVARDEQHAHSILNQALIIQSIVALTVSLSTFLLSPLLANLLGDASLTKYIRFIALVIFLQAYYPVFVQFLSGLHRFTRQALLTSVYALAKLLGALTLLYFFNVYGAFAGFAVGGLMAGTLGWWWTRQAGGYQKKQLPLKSFLSFAGTYVLILVGLQILISLDLFMVKSLLKDDVQAGFYNAAVTLSRISYMLLQALAFILLPSVSALTKPGENHDEAVVFIGQAIRYLIALIVPSVVVAATTSKALVHLFFSQEFSPAAPILSVLMVGVGCLAFYLLLTNIVAGAGRPKVGLLLTLGLVILSGILGMWFIPRWGLIGAAWQTTITGSVGLLILGLYTFRVFGLQYPIKSTINIMLATVVAVLPTYWWQPTTLLLPFLYLLTVVVYISVLFLLREITPDDRRRVAQMHPLLKWVGSR
ncbi:MAG: flippase [Candidatus Andersenbacteria bacterium]